MVSLDLIIANLPSLSAALVVAILFVQSGLDKVFDWSGNLAWLKDHFAKTFLAPTVTLMVATITILEIVTGLAAAGGIIMFLLSGSLALIFIASVLGAATLAALFFGQRVAKDYPGAAVLIPYFLLVLAMMYLSRPA